MRVNQRLLVRTICVILLATSMTQCTESEERSSEKVNATSGTPVVHSVNYPLAYFAERIGGEHVDVRFIVPSDEDPAFWEPTDADIGALQAADLILLNGATYAGWRRHVSLPESRTVDTSRAFADSLIEVAGGATHSHGADGGHSHGGIAFTTWIDIRQARQQAEAVRDALVELVPDARSEIEAAAASLLDDLDRLDVDLEAAAGGIGDQPLVASHPVYQYLARRYNLDISAVLWEPEAVPDDDAMAEIGALLSGHPARWMIWESDPAPESVSKLEALGVQCVVFDPCGNRPDDGHWLDVMRQNVENLEAIGG